MLHPGLYEQLINRALRQELDAIPAERKAIASIDPAEADEVLLRRIAEAAKEMAARTIGTKLQKTPMP